MQSSAIKAFGVSYYLFVTVLLLVCDNHYQIAGLGALAKLSDELLLAVLGHLPAQSLLQAAAASKALYCFCSHEDLWRALALQVTRGRCNGMNSVFGPYCNISRLQRPSRSPDSTLILQEFEGGFCFSTSWQQTYLLAARLASRHQPSRKPLRVQGCFSDLLYQPWFCATTPLRPEWLERDTLERRSDLSQTDFQRLYERPNRPVVLTNVVRCVLLCMHLNIGNSMPAPAEHSLAPTVSQMINVAAANSKHVLWLP